MCQNARWSECKKCANWYTTYRTFPWMWDTEMILHALTAPGRTNSAKVMVLPEYIRASVQLQGDFRDSGVESGMNLQPTNQGLLGQKSG